MEFVKIEGDHTVFARQHGRVEQEPLAVRAGERDERKRELSVLLLLSTERDVQRIQFGRELRNALCDRLGFALADQLGRSCKAERPRSMHESREFREAAVLPLDAGAAKLVFDRDRKRHDSSLLINGKRGLAGCPLSCRFGSVRECRLPRGSGRDDRREC